MESAISVTANEETNCSIESAAILLAIYGVDEHRFCNSTGNMTFQKLQSALLRVNLVGWLA